MSWSVLSKVSPPIVCPCPVPAAVDALVGASLIPPCCKASLVVLEASLNPEAGPAREEEEKQGPEVKKSALYSCSISECLEKASKALRAFIE